MGWPKGRPRPARVHAAPEAAHQVASDVSPDPDALPAGWGKGALLNVRQSPNGFCVTLWPEEYDPERPERAKWFANPAACQDFVSDWYSRQSADPRAR